MPDHQQAGLKKRLPSLDGLRAVSISLVLAWHLEYFWSGRWPTRVVFDPGTLGVFVFFVISGFLITRLLREERKRTGRISLRGFYLRRAFRILPALLFFLTGLGVLSRFGFSHASFRDLVVSLTFTANYRPRSVPVRHLWSLSVEEQFYFFWPIVYSRLSDKNASRLVAGVILVAPIVRLLWLVSGGSGLALEWHFESVADALAMGCLLALNQGRFHASRFYGWFCRRNLFALIPLTFVLGACQIWPVAFQVLGKTMIFASAAFGIDLVIQRPASTVGRFLNSAVLVNLGQWSYSLYLWQQLFFSQNVVRNPMHGFR